MRREIIRIDEERCDGCGQCVDACAEGAIQLVDGVAKLIRDSYCDGLGACIGDCPQDALTIEVRDVEEFDPEAVREHLRRLVSGRADAPPRPVPPPAPHACPGSRPQAFRPAPPPPARAGEAGPGPRPSGLANWPVQLRLVPPTAPYFQGARLLIAADCVPFALADFHRQMLDGHVLLVGCPKLDEVDFYRAKLAEIFRHNRIEDVQVGFMEVPCCFGLVALVQQAMADSGRPLPVTLTKVGIRGEICDTVRVPVEAGPAG